MYAQLQRFKGRVEPLARLLASEHVANGSRKSRPSKEGGYSDSANSG
jgi:hypothetical protein